MSDQLILKPATSVAPSAGASAAGGAPQRLSGDIFGALINLSGRRRFSSQRVVLYAVLASMGHEGAAATARDTLALLRDAHATLTEGRGSLPGVFCEQLREAYFGTLDGDQTIRGFISLAEATLEAIEGNGVGAPQLLDQLVSSATPLLSVLNGLTLVYEEQAKRHAQAQRRQVQEMIAGIKVVARQARVVAFRAQVAAARAAPGAGDFTALASSMTAVTTELDELVGAALGSALAQ